MVYSGTPLPPACFSSSNPTRGITAWRAQGPTLELHLLQLLSTSQGNPCTEVHACHPCLPRLWPSCWGAPSQSGPKPPAHTHIGSRHPTRAAQCRAQRDPCPSLPQLQPASQSYQAHSLHRTFLHKVHCFKKLFFLIHEINKKEKYASNERTR